MKMLNLKTATLLIVAGFVCQTLSAVSLDEFYGVAFGKNMDADFNSLNVKLEHYWKVPIYSAVRLKGTHWHEDFQLRGVAVDETTHFVTATFGRSRGKDVKSISENKNLYGEKYTKLLGSEPQVVNYGIRDNYFEQILTWEFKDDKTTRTAYLVIGVPSVQFAANTGSTSFTMVVTTDPFIARHKEMLSTWAGHEERMIEQALRVLAQELDVDSEQSTVPMKFCGLRLGQILPEGLKPSSKTEMYYGYPLSPKEKILCFNQYQFHASLITRTVTSAGAGYTTQSESDASALFVQTCQWLEEKYPGMKCEDANLQNRRIKVMRFGKYTDGYYMVEKNNPMPGMFLVMITLYNERLSKIEEQEAKEFAGCNMTGQSAPMQFNVQQVNQQINNGKSVLPLLTNSISTLVSGPSSSIVSTTPFDKTKATMDIVRDVIEDYQKRGKTRAVPKDILSLKALGKWKVCSWKDAWGKDFQYECDGERWALQSAGADMKYGTDDDLILVCEDGMNVTSVGFPTGNGRHLDSEVVKQNDKLRKKAEENIGSRKDGWTQIEIPGLVTMDIPPTIELQKGAYKSFKETMAKIVLDLDLRSQSLTFQQSGLNDFEEGSTRRYARIILKNYYDKDDTYDLDDADMTIEAMKFIEDDEYKKLKKGFEQASRAGVPGKLIKWYPVKKVRLSGMTGYRIAFLRQQRDNPPVYVEEYKIGNGHYLHSILFSYRQSEESFWKDDYNEIKNRIKFTKMRR